MGLRDLAKAHLRAIGSGRAGNCPASGHIGVSGPDSEPQAQHFPSVEPVRTTEPVRTLKPCPDGSDNPDISDISDISDRKNRAAIRAGTTDRWCAVCGSLATLAIFNPAKPRSARWLCQYHFEEWKR